MSAHGYDKKVFPLTAAQGRVLYHLERIMRSTGGGQAAHVRYIAAVRAAGLDPQRVQDWTRAQCVQGLILMEEAARAERLHLVRDVGTGWHDFAPACFEPDMAAVVRPCDAMGVS